jgi:hypothetical protein
MHVDSAGLSMSGFTGSGIGVVFARRRSTIAPAIGATFELTQGDYL